MSFKDKEIEALEGVAAFGPCYGCEAGVRAYGYPGHTPKSWHGGTRQDLAAQAGLKTGLKFPWDWIRMNSSWPLGEVTL